MSDLTPGPLEVGDPFTVDVDVTSDEADIVTWMVPKGSGVVAATWLERQQTVTRVDRDEMRREDQALALRQHHGPEEQA